MGGPRRTRKTAPESEDVEQPLLSHLLELRSRLLKAVAGVLLVFIPMAYFAQDLFALLAGPLLSHLPEGTSMIATEVASPFLTPFKLAFILSIVVALPWVAYQIWGFIAPGLYAGERRLVVPLLISSTLLFYLGMAFAYFVVFPLMFAFFIGVAPAGVTVMTDISRYLDFVLTLFLAFGAAFEVPVAVVLMVWAGFVTPARLAAARAYVLVGAFVVGMLLTPPDIISQTLLAVPVYLLYEAGIWLARWLVPGHREVEAQQAETSED